MIGAAMLALIVSLRVPRGRQGEPRPEPIRGALPLEHP
jgi:hypothetical protein